MWVTVVMTLWKSIVYSQHELLCALLVSFLSLIPNISHTSSILKASTAEVLLFPMHMKEGKAMFKQTNSFDPYRCCPFLLVLSL